MACHPPALWLHTIFTPPARGKLLMIYYVIAHALKLPGA